jgi:uncharacterized membrane protein
MRRLLCGLLAVGALVSLAGATKADYVFTTIDPIPGFYTAAYGINNLGQIVGVVGGDGFLLSGGSLIPFKLPGFGTFPRAINDAGDIVGYSSTLTGSSGFLLSGGNLTQISVPGAGQLGTQAHGLNNAGQIVGSYDTPIMNPSPTGFLLTGGNYTTLGNLGPAYGINNVGQIVGGSNLLSGGIVTRLEVPGFLNTNAQAINDVGQIAGWYGAGGVAHGFLLSDGTYTTLDVPAAQSTHLYGINNAGLVVGDYTDAAGSEHGFLASPVPEPSALVLLVIGTLGLMAWAQWRSQGIA